MFSRREFLRHIAAISVGTAAVPEQIDILERIYNINTPEIEKDLISVDEIWISGLAKFSSPTSVIINCGPFLAPLYLTVNCFGGIVRWVATAEGKIIMDKNKLDISFKEHFERGPNYEKDVAFTKGKILIGHIHYLDQDLRSQTLGFEY
jgi:hypothetical protein